MKEENLNIKEPLNKKLEKMMNILISRDLNLKEMTMKKMVWTGMVNLKKQERIWNMLLQL